MEEIVTQDPRIVMTVAEFLILFATYKITVWGYKKVKELMEKIKRGY